MRQALPVLPTRRHQFRQGCPPVRSRRPMPPMCLVGSATGRAPAPPIRSRISIRLARAMTRGLPIASLNESQIECLHGLEQQLERVVVAYGKS